MAKTTKKKISTQKLGMAWMAIGFLLLVNIVLLSFVVSKANTEVSVEKPTRDTVDLGIMQYKIEDDRAVKRDDPIVHELEAYLTDKTSRGCPAESPNHAQVAVHTEDLSQVLLRYGCGYPSGNMFAIYEDGSWRGVSPTSQFDEFGIPNCEHVEEHSISTELAPVCGSGEEGREYTIR